MTLQIEIGIGIGIDIETRILFDLLADFDSDTDFDGRDSSV